LVLPTLPPPFPLASVSRQTEKERRQARHAGQPSLSFHLRDCPTGPTEGEPGGSPWVSWRRAKPAFSLELLAGNRTTKGAGNSPESRQTTVLLPERFHAAREGDAFAFGARRGWSGCRISPGLSRSSSSGGLRLSKPDRPRTYRQCTPPLGGRQVPIGRRVASRPRNTGPARHIGSRGRRSPRNRP